MKHLLNLEFELLEFQMIQVDFSILASNDSAKSKIIELYESWIKIIEYITGKPRLGRQSDGFPKFSRSFSVSSL